MKKIIILGANAEIGFNVTKMSLKIIFKLLELIEK